MEPTADIALIGLAVMGQNLILNMNDHGYTVVAFNRTVSKVDDFLNDAAKGRKTIIGARTADDAWRQGTAGRSERRRGAMRAGYLRAAGFDGCGARDGRRDVHRDRVRRRRPPRQARSGALPAGGRPARAGSRWLRGAGGLAQRRR